MIRLSNLTFAGLLDHVEAHLLRWARGRETLPPRAYAADAAGVVTVLAFPLPSDDAGREALGAILELEMQRRAAVMVVVALPSWASPATTQPTPAAEGQSQEVLLLDGRVLSGAPGGARRATRILAIERRAGGRIARLTRIGSEEAGLGSAATGGERRQDAMGH
jgi:hypothetical protein